MEIVAQHPQVQRMNRLFGWMGLGIQLALIGVPFLLSLAGVYQVNVGKLEGIFYVWYIWFAFPVVTLFIAWLFIRAGAFRSGGPSRWGLMTSVGTLLLWAIVFSCHLNRIEFLGGVGRYGPR